MLPHEFGRAAAPRYTPRGGPEIESTWIGPHPIQAMGIAPGRVNLETSYEQREGLELAFVASLQRLAATLEAGAHRSKRATKYL